MEELKKWRGGTNILQWEMRLVPALLRECLGIELLGERMGW